MKMTKIESARIIAESTDTSACWSILCSKCFNSRKGKTCKDGNLVAIEKAKAYIKRHESKTKKKDHILDTTKKVTRPNFRKYLRDKIDMKVRVNPELSEELQKIAGEEGIKTRGGDLLPKNTGCRIIRFYCCDHYSMVYYPGVVTFEKIEATEYNPETDTLVEKVEEPKPIKTVGIDNSDVTLAQYEPTPLQIAKMIRDNGYSCLNRFNQYNKAEFSCSSCPLGKNYCGQMIDIAPAKDKALRKKLIDDYISANEPVKDCPANSKIPQPIKFEDEVPFNLYTVTEYGIFRFTALRFHSEKTKEKDGTTITKEKVFAFEGDRKFDGTKKEVTIDINNCYKTLEEAVIVAKKLWNGDGK